MRPASDARRGSAIREGQDERHYNPACRDCRAGLEHCHGTLIHHWLHRCECTDDDCAGPELLPHTFVVDCDAVGCDCALIDAAATLAV